MGANLSKVKTVLKLLGAFSLGHLLVKIVFLYRQIRQYKRQLGHLPGPKGYFGTELIANLGRLHEYRTEYVQKYPDSKLLTTNGPGLNVIAYDRDSVKAVLKDEFNFCTKPSADIDPLFSLLAQFIGGQGIFCLRHGKDLSSTLAKEHKLWYDQRKTASVIFTKRQFETFMHQVFTEKMETFIRVLDKHAKAETHVDIQNLFFIFTMNSIQKLFFGRDINTLESGKDTVGDAFDEAHRLMLRSNVDILATSVFARAFLPWPIGTIFGKTDSSLLNWITKLRSKNYADFKKVTKELHKEVDGIIRAARKDPMISKRKDLLANFMNSTKIRLSTTYLRHLILNFIIAGRDTTACTLSWLFYELSVNPEIQEKLYEELDAALPDNKIPSYADLMPQNLPYLNGCIMETLRMHPPVPEDGKFSTTDVQFPDGTVVPKNTRLIFLPYAMGRDPRRFPNPDKFDPERWIPYTKYPDAYDFPVFQAGYRECLGKDMALFESKLVATMLVQRFSFTLKPGEQENITYSFMVTMSICNSGPLKNLDDERTHELWLKPTRRTKAASH